MTDTPQLDVSLAATFAGQVLADEVRRLDELRSSPNARTNRQLLQAIEEVYALLPADMGEAQFGS